MDANITPVRMTEHKLSGAAVLLIVLLGLGSLYAIARTADIVDRLHFISKIENGEFAREINNGTLTRQQFEDRAKAIDDRSTLFVNFSWVLSIALFLGYRNWNSRGHIGSLPAEKRWMSRLAGVLWIVILAAQAVRYVINSDTLSALKTSSYINLVSRVLILPAVALSVIIIRARERGTELAA